MALAGITAIILARRPGFRIPLPAPIRFFPAMTCFAFSVVFRSVELSIPAAFRIVAALALLGAVRVISPMFSIVKKSVISFVGHTFSSRSEARTS
jgi:hypothetical protein